MNLFAVYFALQQQVLTPSAAESIAKSGNGLLLQAPILLAAVIGLLVAVIKFRSYRLVSILTIVASLLLFVSSLASPLVSVWLPFFLVTQQQQSQPQTTPDGAVAGAVLQATPVVETLPTYIFYSNLISSAVVALALLIYLAAIFTGRARAKSSAFRSPDITIPKISIK